MTTETIHDTPSKASAWEKKLITLIKYASFTFPLASLLSLNIFFFPEVFTKQIFFYILAEMLVFLYLLLVFRNPGYLPGFFSTTGQNKRRYHWIFIFLAGYLGVVSLTTLFSVSIYKSFFGTVDRSNGLLVLLHFFGIFVVLSSVFKKDAFWLLLLRLFSGTGLFIALAGIYQRLANDNLAPDVNFGNMAYLSSYLLFIIFGAMALWFWEKKLYWKLFHGLTFFSATASVIYTTDIRGSKLAIMFGLATFFFYLLSGSKKNLVRKATLSLAAAGLVIFTFYGLYAIKTGKVYGVFQRSYTIKTRLLAWDAGIKGFKNKPLMGYGLENFGGVFDTYFDPTYYTQETGAAGNEWGMTFPHNKVVEVAVSSGVFALVAYLGLFAAVFLFNYKKYLETREKKYPALGALFAAYFVNMFFLFDTITTFAAFFVFLAYLQSTLPNHQATAIKERTEKAYDHFFISLAMIFCIILFFVVMKPVKDNLVYMEARKSAAKSDWKNALAYMEKVQNNGVYWIGEKAIKTQITDDLEFFRNKKNLTEDEKTYLRGMVKAAEFNVSKNPSLSYYTIILGLMNNVAGSFDETYWKNNTRLMQELIDKGNKRYDAYVILAESYVRLGQKDKVGPLEKTAIALDPRSIDTYIVFGGVYLKAEEYGKAAELFAAAIDHGCRDVVCYQGTADANIPLQQYAKAITAYQEIMKRKKDDPQVQATLAQLYVNNKEYDKARALAENMKKQFPAITEKINAFLTTLPQ